MSIEIDDKTEQPTERRRRQAREDGLGPRSADLGTACRWLGVAVAVQFFGGSLVFELSQFLADSLQRPWLVELTADTVVSLSWEAVGRLAFSCLGCCSCVWVGCLVAHFWQVGVRFQPEDLMPDFSRLSPFDGLARLWKVENAAQAGWGLVKYVTIVTLGGWYLWTNLGRLSNLPESDLATIAQITGNSFVMLAWLLAGVFLLFGLGDYGYQLWKFEQSLKMTPAELREENREETGRAHWKQQRRDVVQRQRSTDTTGSVRRAERVATPVQ